MIFSIIFKLKQWIALEARADWRLKFQISLVNMHIYIYIYIYTKTVDSFENAR